MSHPTFDLTGKVALITGGGSGLGRGLALGLARAGAAVAVAARQIERLETTAETIRAEGGRALALPLDVAALDQHAPAVERVVGELGGLDILVNCAGTGARTRAIEMTEEEWDRTFGTNLKGALFLSQAAARHMKDHGGGRIINIASLTVKLGISFVVHYGASKAGMMSITRTLAIEWAPFGDQRQRHRPRMVPHRADRRYVPKSGVDAISDGADSSQARRRAGRTSWESRSCSPRTPVVT